MLPSRNSDLMLMFRSITGAFSSFNESEMVRYEDIMKQQSDRAPAEARCDPLARDFDATQWTEADNTIEGDEFMDGASSESDSGP